jgi:predicted outer membrane repeat protein
MGIATAMRRGRRGAAVVVATVAAFASVGVTPAGASTTVSTASQLKAAWANGATTDIVLGADIAVCGMLTRQSTTAVSIHGKGHVLRQGCTGTILRQTSSGAVNIDHATLRDAHYNANFERGAALEASAAAVQLDHVLVTNNEAAHGAIQAQSLVVTDSTVSNNGAQAFDISGGGAAVVGADVTVLRSTFANNQVYGDGAAIRAGGHAQVTASQFNGNQGKGGGEAVTAGSADIAGSSFTGNLAYAAPMGGAVNGGTQLNVLASTFSGNEGGIGDGGAIGAQTVDVGRSTFDGNTTDTGRGGAIFGDDVSVSTSTFHANTTASDGGAIHAEHSLSVFSSTFDANSSGSNPMATYGSQGGAISGQTGASLSIVNSTFTANQEGAGFDGAAIAADGPLNLQFDTIASNPPQDSTFSQVFATAGSTVKVRGTVIVGAIGAHNCSAAVSSRGANYDDDGTCGFTGTGDTSSGPDPHLGALGPNGGPTSTMRPATGSPLIDAVIGTCVPRDQRGVARPQGPRCDIGSVEQ